jgi:spoIIIJ-associated protein
MSEVDTAGSGEKVTTDGLDAREQGAIEILQEICDASGLDLMAQPLTRHSPYLDVELTGSSAPSTFGRHGYSLDALQYLSNLIISKRIGPDVRVILDAAGYRERRATSLIELAREFAEQVKDRQEECELDPLPAHERRLIHNALSDDPGIRTYSEGDDPDRRVIIAPAL